MGFTTSHQPTPNVHKMWFKYQNLTFTEEISTKKH